MQLKLNMASRPIIGLAVTLAAISTWQTNHCSGQQTGGELASPASVAESKASQNSKSDSSAIIAASKSDRLTDVQFDLLTRSILPSAEEAKWRATAWLPSIDDGRTKAVNQNRPLFVWAMNGDPLGCV